MSIGTVSLAGISLFLFSPSCSLSSTGCFLLVPQHVGPWPAFWFSSSGWTRGCNPHFVDNQQRGGHGQPPRLYPCSSVYFPVPVGSPLGDSPICSLSSPLPSILSGLISPPLYILI